MDLQSDALFLLHLTGNVFKIVQDLNRIYKATRVTAAHYGVQISPYFPVPSNCIGCLGVMNNYESLLPNKKALFDIPVAPTASAYLTSLVLAVAAFVADGSFNGGDNALCLKKYNMLASQSCNLGGSYCLSVIICERPCWMLCGNFGSLEEFQEEFKDINQEEQISKLHKMLAPHLLRRVYLWLQITDKMKARASLEVIGNNDRILDCGTHQTNGNL
uniref:Uncharacterized protein n=1 Tax=Quercus lobata TaxID=97700 RepID=A0A7N2LFP8_QUELO